MSYRKKEEYLKVLEEQIRCKKARSQVVEEIRGHMEEQEAFYLSEGLTQEEAEEETVKEMGDPVEAGAALAQRFTRTTEARYIWWIKSCGEVT
ncbi:MAG: hypothetical protein HFG93_14485, partial [Dorea sp.]|nr:hypothetical protein [Dorea sp.]